jgi:glycine hydroxymethyltransferase
MKSSTSEIVTEIRSLVHDHEEWRGKECLNLIPSENITSPAVQELISSDLGHRYTAADSFYMGTKFIDKIEECGEKIAEELFDAETADLRPLSGHIADLIFLGSFTKPNDVVMCVSPKDGGYPGIWKDGLADFLGLKAVPFPFSKQDMNIPIDKAREAIENVHPRVVVFGASFITFPHPVKELAESARENDAYVGYDGSHVMGLIAGEQFQDPLREGVDALFGSTHKTLFGPQGGIILADKEYGESLKQRIYPTFVDNAHWNRIAALTLALAEMKEFGRAYAKQVVHNAKVLAEALHDYGLPVICQHLGFTRSHQVLLDYGNYEGGRAIAEKLEQASIIVDCGVRIGTCEVTRRGMKENEILRIAEMIKRTIVDKEKPKEIQQDVANLCNDFQRVEYCFEK